RSPLHAQKHCPHYNIFPRNEQSPDAHTGINFHVAKDFCAQFGTYNGRFFEIQAIESTIKIFFCFFSKKH
ncbi:MAG: hypothetical protein RR337_04150, partial [Clostridia bacterium]